jgi:RES domain
MYWAWSTCFRLARIQFIESSTFPCLDATLGSGWGPGNRCVSLARTSFALGVHWSRYGTLGYERTQAIRAAVAHLKCDGLIAPSARWTCENVMLFRTNQTSEEEIARLVASEEVDWRAWARDKGVAVPPT